MVFDGLQGPANDNAREPVWAVVRGRMGSERLPGKTMADLRGTPSLVRILRRLQRVPELDGIVVATTTNPEDDVIAAAARAEGVEVYRGSAEDVLGRTVEAAQSVGAGSIVAVTGDCPLVEPALVSRIVDVYWRERPDNASNKKHGYMFPIGLDVEVFPTYRLAEIAARATESRYREHVTLWFYEHQDELELVNVAPTPHQHRPELRLTLDTDDDLRVIRAIYEALEPSKPQFDLDDVLRFLDAHPDVAAWSGHVVQRRP